eukprot:tig00000586_g2254.t1
MGDWWGQLASYYRCYSDSGCTGAVLSEGSTTIDGAFGTGSTNCSAVGAKSFGYNEMSYNHCHNLSVVSKPVSNDHVTAMIGAGWKNVGFGSSAAASSEYPGGYTANLLTDGTGEHGDFGRTKGWHSGQSDPKPQVSIVLEKDFMIGEIDVYNRSDNGLGFRYDDIIIEVLNDGELVYQTPTISEPLFNPKYPNLAQHVIPKIVGDSIRITKIPSSANGQVLNFSEVDVWGKETASPAPARPVLSNVALNMPATASSEHDSVKFYAGRAVDGLGLHGDFMQTFGFSSLFGGDAAPWWKVDLQKDCAISSVKIHNRTDNGTSTRLKNFVVQVLDNGKTVYETPEIVDPAFDPANPNVFTLPLSGIVGDAVKLSMPSGGCINIGEVEVIGTAAELTEAYQCKSKSGLMDTLECKKSNHVDEAKGVFDESELEFQLDLDTLDLNDDIFAELDSEAAFSSGSSEVALVE